MGYAVSTSINAMPSLELASLFIMTLIKFWHYFSNNVCYGKSNRHIWVLRLPELPVAWEATAYWLLETFSILGVRDTILCDFSPTFQPDIPSQYLQGPSTGPLSVIFLAEICAWLHLAPLTTCRALLINTSCFIRRNIKGWVVPKRCLCTEVHFLF